jgi:hypothetical protein
MIPLEKRHGFPESAINTHYGLRLRIVSGLAQIRQNAGDNSLCGCAVNPGINSIDITQRLEQAMPFSLQDYEVMVFLDTREGNGNAQLKGHVETNRQPNPA